MKCNNQVNRIRNITAGMASPNEQPTSTHEANRVSSPQPNTSTQPARPASIVSSRMTDVGSDDGNATKSPQGPDAPSQPETTNTALSSKGAMSLQSARKNYPAGRQPKRGSLASSTGAASSTGNRSHVPSLTSNAFFRPMSSQKLQAQRAVAKPTTPLQPMPEPENFDETMTDAGASVIPPDSQQPSAFANRRLASDASARPYSRGTEMADQETLDRLTANTSPTQGHFPNGSLTDSVRPLHGRTGSGPDEQPKSAGPGKSSRSFRSSFLLPGRSDQGQSTRHRSTDGAEKLSSSASSPRLHAVDSRGRPIKSRDQQSQNNRGWVYQYFEGNTIFCLGGRWQNTKHRPVNIATGIFVLVPCILFFVFEASWLWHNISPALPIVFAYLACICMSSFVHASVSDPGVSTTKI